MIELCVVSHSAKLPALSSAVNHSRVLCFGDASFKIKTLFGYFLVSLRSKAGSTDSFCYDLFQYLRRQQLDVAREDDITQYKRQFART